jgi:hypothetical protein
MHAGLGVAKKQTDKARQTFQRSAQQAGFFAYGQDRLVMPAVGPGMPEPKKDDEVKPDEQQRKKTTDDGNGGGVTRSFRAYSKNCRTKAPNGERLSA